MKCEWCEDMLVLVSGFQIETNQKMSYHRVFELEEHWSSCHGKVWEENEQKHKGRKLKKWPKCSRNEYDSS